MILQLTAGAPAHARQQCHGPAGLRAPPGRRHPTHGGSQRWIRPGVGRRSNHAPSPHPGQRARRRPGRGAERPRAGREGRPEPAVTARPKLRRDLVLVEQTYRGEQSYIVKDPESRKYFRFRPVEVMVMQALDGEHTAEEAAAALAEEGIRVTRQGSGGVRRQADEHGALRAHHERALGAPDGTAPGRAPAAARQGYIPGRYAAAALVGRRPRQAVRPLAAPASFLLHPHLSVDLGRALRGVSSWCSALKWPEFSRALADLYTFNVSLGTLAVLWLTGTGHHRHSRAGPRFHLQVLRRAGPRDRRDAHLLRAGLLLQRERRLDLPRAPGAAYG